MPVPSLITDLSQVVASNSPAGSESPGTADDYFRAHAAFIAQLRAVIGGAVNPNIPTNITIGVTDTTAGRVLKVGDFGLGTPIGGGSLDFNSFVWTGFATADGTESQAASLNWPSTGLAGGTPVWFTLQTIANAGQSRISQVATECYTNIPGVRQWVRTKHDTAWTAWSEVATSGNSLGKGQYWQDVTGSMALNTNYTNSTGRAISIILEGITSGGAMKMFCNAGGPTVTVATTPVAASTFTTSSIIIPNGATYKFVPDIGGVSVVRWVELR